jgi:hypothetical protein
VSAVGNLTKGTAGGAVRSTQAVLGLPAGARPPHEWSRFVSVTTVRPFLRPRPVVADGKPAAVVRTVAAAACAGPAAHEETRATNGPVRRVRENSAHNS